MAYLVQCFIVFILLTVPHSLAKQLRVQEKSYSEKHECDKFLSSDLKDEIASYDPVVRDILDYTISGPYKGKTYDGLAAFVDKFGPRLSGSTVLEEAIDYMINLARGEDVNDITTEDVKVPHWVRGFESVTMLEPRVHNMSVLAFGYSISTPPEGITAEVVVVDSFEELDDLEEGSVKDKIVLYNPPYVSYGETVKYRVQGATKAAQKGAVAALVRSIAPFSINSPHTGMQKYGDNITKIPTAAITIEDAAFIERLYDRNETIILKILLFSKLDEKISRNTLIDAKGRSNPEKMVIVSGHIDSWDVGEGAMDDGGGMMISWAVPVILKRLGLRSKRTIRSILWTGEELGLVGAKSYAEKHNEELSNINFIMESDEGTFKPTGLAVAGSTEARCIVAEILKLFQTINATKLVEEDYPGSDITILINKGKLPGAGLINQNEKYFWFHHSEGDTMTVENSEELDLCAAFWTAAAYIIADITVDIPRGS